MMASKKAVRVQRSAVRRLLMCSLKGAVMTIKEELRKNFLKCKELLSETSKNDPETDPYSSKKKVIKILNFDLDIINKFMGKSDTTDPEHEFCAIYQPLILAYIGMTLMEMEELAEGEDYLKKSMDCVKNPLNPFLIFISIETRNHLGYVSLRRSKAEEALKFLKDAEKLYCDFRNNSDSLAKNIFHDVYSDEEELENAHTMTKFYLAQAYEVLNEIFKSSVYCHETLKRQLKHKNLDSIDWAMNSAKLCQFFMDRMLFKQCRSHMAAASHILDEYGNSLGKLEGSQEEMEAKKEEFRHRSADLSWCWAKYGVFILQHSRYKASNPKDDIVGEQHEDLKRLIFDDMDLARYEDQITDTVVVAFEDAREVFLFSQRHFNKAKEYYTLQERASKHVQIVRDHSHLFHLLSAFEPDDERQFKMLKKRADMLEVVLKELNPRYYMDICRQLWFELGEIYHDMMQIKAGKYEKVPTPQTLKKVNSLIDSSVEQFNHFLDSVRDKKTGNLPDPLQEDLIGPTLTAHFYLGRLHFKYITDDKHSQEINTKKTYKYLKYLVNYCERNEEAKAIMDEKYEISKDLSMLLLMRLLQL